MRELCVLEGDDSAYTVLPVRRQQHKIRSRNEPPKGVSIASLIEEKIRSKTFFLSVELIPGTTAHLQNLLDKSLEEISQLAPLFASVTWHEGHLKFSKSGDGVECQHPALDLCKLLQNSYGIPALMHLSAGNLKLPEIRIILEACLAAGVTNILALRGDERNEKESHVPHASDLVRFIKKGFGSEITIGVAGYPSAHPEATSLHEDLIWLKEKVDAGADYILTQMITTFDEIHNFTKDCVNVGVNVPVVPGLFLIESFKIFENVTKACHVKVPQQILEEIKELNDETKENNYGKHLLLNILERVLTTSCCPGVHFFTMNRVSTVIKLCESIPLI